MSIHSFCLSTCKNTFERISRFVIFLKIHLSQLSDQQNFFSWPMTLYYYAILESSSSNWRRSIRERKLWICQHQWMEFWSCTFSLFSTLWRSIFFLVSNSTLVFFMSEISEEKEDNWRFVSDTVFTQNRNKGKICFTLILMFASFSPFS